MNALGPLRGRRPVAAAAVLALTISSLLIPGPSMAAAGATNGQCRAGAAVPVVMAGVVSTKGTVSCLASAPVAFADATFQLWRSAGAPGRKGDILLATGTASVDFAKRPYLASIQVSRACRANSRSATVYTRTRVSSPVTAQGGATVTTAWAQSAKTTVVC